MHMRFWHNRCNITKLSDTNKMCPANKDQEVIEMRTLILSILIALTVLIAGPLAFAGQDQVQEQVTESTEVVTEVNEPSNISEVIDSLSAEATEDCSNKADDDGDERVDCEDTDCVEDPNCKGGY